jgi:hypothetical protein
MGDWGSHNEREAERRMARGKASQCTVSGAAVAKVDGAPLTTARRTEYYRAHAAG